MHWVERGPEPEGLAPIRARYTPRWVDFYRHGVGERPPGDSRWRDFQVNLNGVFSGLCGYCEEPCKGEVDHFRPQSRYPEYVYQWSNWVFACHDCNHAKREKWPNEGYVDPCAGSIFERPENFFNFDTRTGELLPKQSLSGMQYQKAQGMISDLQLNDEHHLKQRREWIVLVSGAIPENSSAQTTEEQALRCHLVSRSTQLSSLSRAWLTDRGYSIDS